MSDVVVYKGFEGSAQSLLKALQGKGISARILDDPNPFARHTSAGTYRFRVAVPDKQLGMAHYVLAEWTSQNAQPVQEKSSRVVGIFAIGLTGPALWWLLSRLAPDPFTPPSVPGAILLWLLCTIVAAQIEHRRRKRETVSLPKT